MDGLVWTSSVVAGVDRWDDDDETDYDGDYIGTTSHNQMWRNRSVIQVVGTHLKLCKQNK